jgi:hypothetical protein
VHGSILPVLYYGAAVSSTFVISSSLGKKKGRRIVFLLTRAFCAIALLQLVAGAARGAAVEIVSWSLHASENPTIFTGGGTPVTVDKSGGPSLLSQTASASIVGTNGHGQTTAVATFYLPTLMTLGPAPGTSAWVEGLFVSATDTETIAFDSSVQATLVFDVTEPVLAVVEGAFGSGGPAGGVGTITGPGGFDYHIFNGSHDNVNYYKTLGAGRYTMLASGPGAFGGQPNSGYSQAQIYFLAPEPASIATTMLLAFPALLRRRRR